MAMIDDIGIRAKGESTSAVDLVPLWRMSGDEFEDLGIQGYDSGVEIVENMMYGNPTAFLFDEPLSNLDAKLCVPMHAEIQRLQKQTGITSI